MSLKTIVVQVADVASCEARFEVALQLAVSHDARLVGLYVDRIYAYEWNSLTVDNVRSHNLDEEATGIHTVFQELSRRVNVNLEWRVIKKQDETEIGLHARYSDLIVIGQPDPKDRFYTSPDFPAALTLAVARPVLVIPHDYELQPIGRNVLLTWNRSREATRAMADALVLLKRAQKVTVLIVDHAESTPEAGEEPGSDIALYLARHGVNVEVCNDKSENDDGTVASRIIANAERLRADLIVMGANGHSRLRELIIGGVTRSMIRQMRVPILMSH